MRRQLVRLAEAKNQDTVGGSAMRCKHIERLQGLAGEFRHTGGTDNGPFGINIIDRGRRLAGNLQEDRKAARRACRLCKTDIEGGSHEFTPHGGPFGL